MYYNLLNATCNLDLPESDRIINKLIVVADKEEVQWGTNQTSALYLCTIQAFTLLHFLADTLETKETNSNFPQKQPILLLKQIILSGFEIWHMQECVYTHLKVRQ